MDREMILIQLRTNLVFVLNETATRLWELIGENRELDHIEQQLLEEYDVDKDQLEREIDETLSELIRQGLLRDSDGA